MERPTYTARLVRKQLLSARTETYHFTFVAEELDSFPFAAGQFVSLLAEDARGKQQTRAYSLASAASGNCFELCVNRVEGGFFSNLLADLPEGGKVRFHGPHGLFTLREPVTDSMLISTGTGVAPMRGFVQHLFPPGEPSRLPGDKRLWIIYGTRHDTELYYRDEFEAVAAAHANLRYLPTLSRPAEGWAGATGYVQDLVAAVLRREEAAGGATRGPDSDPMHPESDTADNPRRPEANVPPESFSVHAYICGLNAMVSANRELLKGMGWHRKQIIFERYD